MEFAEVYLELRRGGNVKVMGDCRAQGHEGEIELLDWGWGLKLEDLSSDDKAEQRQAVGSLLVLSKPVDRASTAMMSLLQSGETCDQATLTLAQNTEKAVSVKVILKGVRLMSYDLEVECGELEVELYEKWKLTYDKMEVRYVSAAAAGRSGSAKVFSLEMPPGSKLEEPVEHASAAPTPDVSPAKAVPDKDAVIRIVQDYLKTLKLPTK